MSIEFSKNDQGENREENHLSLVLLILAGGILLRFLFLGRSGFWLDEAYSVWVADRALKDIFPLIIIHDPHPPLFYVILHWWMGLLNLLGTESPPEWLLRIPFAVISSVALIPFYFLSSRLLGARLGMYALFMWAFSSTEVMTAQEVRMYAFVELFALLSIFYYLNIRREGGFFNTAAYSIFTALMLYTHYTGIFIIIAQHVDFLLSMRPGEWKRWMSANAGVVLLFLP
ncbi:MAG: glycosyltransferase family 39 protein, partial [Candidatus Eremiobacteraeota bacterium]|nr:glycosyltransferase family 39 protein [Candidatus Eremiobacteraeota bacterium]